MTIARQRPGSKAHAELGCVKFLSLSSILTLECVSYIPEANTRSCSCLFLPLDCQSEIHIQNRSTCYGCKIRSRLQYFPLEPVSLWTLYPLTETAVAAVHNDKYCEEWIGGGRPLFSSASHCRIFWHSLDFIETINCSTALATCRIRIKFKTGKL